MVAYFPLFLHLDALPLRVFDESRLGLNCAEMLGNGNFLIPYCEGVPDMWNTKPPLLLWIQAAFFKWIGPGELALRLPSAIAALLTILTLVVFAQRHLQSFAFGFIAAMVLLTSEGYVAIHGTRTGDYDALLTLFITLYSLSAYMFSQTGKHTYIRWFFVFVTLAVLTKSVQALIMLPAVGAFAMVFGRKHFSRSLLKETVVGALASFAVIASYYLGREVLNPGYIQAVWENELGGRYSNILEDNSGPFMFYFHSLTHGHFGMWHLMVPVGAVVGFLAKDERIKRLTLFSLLLTLWYWLIISSAQTKLTWYEIPLFPWLCMLVGIGIYMVFKVVQESTIAQRSLVFNVAPWVMLLYIFQTPYCSTIDRVYFPKEYSWDTETYEIFHYLQESGKGRTDLQTATVCATDYDIPYLFYQYLLEEKGKHIELTRIYDLQVGDTVLIHYQYHKNLVDSVFDHQKRTVYGQTVDEYILTGKKE